MANFLRNLLSINPKFAPTLAKTMLGSRNANEADGFSAFCTEKALEFTTDWADKNVPFIAPIIRRFAKGRAGVRYLEIGAYEGRNLAFMSWLNPAPLNVTVIDPWFDDALNPEEKYHAVEPRFHRNISKLKFKNVRIEKGFSTYILPEMLKAGTEFDLIYVDGSHTAWAVNVDLAYCAALLPVGGMMILDDYWHDVSEIGGPGVKQAVDAFYEMLGPYFEVTAVYRQVVLTKTSQIPR